MNESLPNACKKGNREHAIKSFIAAYMRAVGRCESQNGDKSTLECENDILNELGLDMSYEHCCENEGNGKRNLRQLNELVKLRNKVKHEKIEKLKKKMRQCQSNGDKFVYKNELYSSWTHDNSNNSNDNNDNNNNNNNNSGDLNYDGSLMLNGMSKEEYFYEINSIRIAKCVGFDVAQRILRLDRLLKQEKLRYSQTKESEVGIIVGLMDKVNELYPICSKENEVCEIIRLDDDNEENNENESTRNENENENQSETANEKGNVTQIEERKKGEILTIDIIDDSEDIETKSESKNDIKIDNESRNIENIEKNRKEENEMNGKMNEKEKWIEQRKKSSSCDDQNIGKKMHHSTKQLHRKKGIEKKMAIDNDNDNGNIVECKSDISCLNIPNNNCNDDAKYDTIEFNSDLHSSNDMNNNNKNNNNVLMENRQNEEKQIDNESDNMFNENNSDQIKNYNDYYNLKSNFDDTNKIGKRSKIDNCSNSSNIENSIYNGNRKHGKITNDKNNNGSMKHHLMKRKRFDKEYYGNGNESMVGYNVNMMDQSFNIFRHKQEAYIEYPSSSSSSNNMKQASMRQKRRKHASNNNSTSNSTSNNETQNGNNYGLSAIGNEIIDKYELETQRKLQEYNNGRNANCTITGKKRNGNAILSNMPQASKKRRKNGRNANRSNINVNQNPRRRP